MLEAIVGSLSAERVMLYLAAKDKGYATEIARAFGTDLSPIQKQLDRLERDGLLIQEKVGRTRVYEFNPRYPFINELMPVLTKALTMLPESLQVHLVMDRRRPRKKDKPL